MSQLKLDHIFCFCEPLLPEAILAEKNGFVLTPGNRHTEQGTANRSIMFKENFLEFIFLEAQKDAENNPLQLHRRAFWKKTGSSPFGIGLRGHVPSEELNQFWEYKPPYWSSEVILIHRNNEERPDLPLVFIVPPRNGKVDAALFAHPNGSTKMVSVHISGPSYKWPLKTPVEGLSFKNSEVPQMKILVDGEIKSEISLNELLSIAGEKR
jgi:hypothetical protein